MIKPKNIFEHFLHPRNDYWVDTLVLWHSDYGINIPLNKEELLNMTELIIVDNDLPRLPAGIVHLTNLNKVILKSNQNLALSVEQKRWLKFLEKRGCEVIVDKDTLKKDLIPKSNQLVKCEAVVSDKLETNYSFGYKILLRKVTVNGKPFRGHTFVKFSKYWEGIELGTKVKFNARISTYYHKRKKRKGLRRLRNIRPNVDLASA